MLSVGSSRDKAVPGDGWEGRQEHLIGRKSDSKSESDLCMGFFF